LAAFDEVILPALRRYQPELIFIASGLDASAMDPLGRMMCTSATYRAMTSRLMSVADVCCSGRLVATHEGGYSNAYVPFCGLAVLETLSDRRSDASDPYVDELMSMAGHDVLAHQQAVIDSAAALVAAIPGPA
jgi:acetoin utilization deacetylase AcuC-like enzyme